MLNNDNLIVPIENIKELRSASDARYYREQFQLAQEYEDRWLTIIYIMDGNYKTLHLIASTKDVFQMWDITLRKLYAIRQQLMSGLGNGEMRQAVWEKQYWKGADDGQDQKLDFEETERLCRRLNVNSSTDMLLWLFKVCVYDIYPSSQLMSNSFHSKQTLRTAVILTFRNFNSSSRC
jgi:phosphatidylinositol phospholipase C, delta